MGFEIGVHTRAHLVLPALDDAAVRDELRRGRSALDGLSATAAPLAYPHGRADARVAVAARAAGYAVAYTGREEAVTARSDPQLLGRIDAAPLTASELAVSAVRALARATLRGHGPPWP